jgi:hypothetical protein
MPFASHIRSAEYPCQVNNLSAWILATTMVLVETSKHVVYGMIKQFAWVNVSLVRLYQKGWKG